MTHFRKNTTSISIINMDNQYHTLLTLLSLLTAVELLNSAFYSDATAYIYRRQAIIPVICNYRPNASCVHWHTHAQCARVVKWYVFSGVLVWTENWYAAKTIVWTV